MHKFILSTTRSLIGAAISAHLLAIRFGHTVHTAAVNRSMKRTDTARVVREAATARVQRAVQAENDTRKQATLYRSAASAESASLRSVVAGQGALDL